MVEMVGKAAVRPVRTDSTIGDGLARHAAYGTAGGDGFCCPVLVDRACIETVASSTELPLNVMHAPSLPDLQTMAYLEVRRLSLGTSLDEASLSVVRPAWSDISSVDIGHAGELDYAMINDIMGR